MIGETVSHYRILDHLGGGGMGVVYKAEDLSLRRTVALKFLPAHLSRDPEANKRFVLEAQAASALDHPNICTIHEIGETPEGELFICMAYYDGQLLKNEIANGPLPVERAIDIGLQVAKALTEAHKQGIVHRDIKPANVMIGRNGLVKVVDFGLAKLKDEVSFTREGMTMGSPAYMSPEQAMAKSVDHRTDLWSLGVVLYEMVTGRRPFLAEHEQAVIFNILNLTPPRLSELFSNLPQQLETILEKALEKDALDRYASASDMARDLQSLVPGSDSADSLHLEASEIGAPSVAVLPFADLSPEGDQEWFCDGLAEEVTTALAQVEGLRVASRTSAFQFKGKAEDVRRIGQRLNVTTVLEGGVRKSADRFRITAQLLKVTDGYSLWSKRFDREMEDIFATQDEIARDIVETLKVHLVKAPSGPLVPRPTGSVQAYGEYLKGRYYWNKRTEDALRKGLKHFQTASELDPEYALAYVGIADSYVTLGGSHGVMAPAEVMPLAQKAAERGLKLGPALAEAHCSMASIRSFFEWDWPAAERDFLKAIELDPSYPTAHQWYAMQLLLPLARFSEAEEALGRAAQLDPVSSAILVSRGVIAYFAGDSERAIEDCRRTLDLDPRFALAYYFLGLALERQQRFGEALDALETALSLSGNSLEVTAAAGQVLALSGETDRAREVLEEIEERSQRAYVSPFRRAQVLVSLGEHEAALAALDDALGLRAAELVWLDVHPLFEPIRKDRRFQRLLGWVGLSDRTEAPSNPPR